MLKLILVVSLIVGVGAMFGMLGYYEIKEIEKSSYQQTLTPTTVSFSGMLISGGVECRLFETDNDIVYSLQSAGRITENFKNGDLVNIRGIVVEKSYCMQGKQTIKVLEINYANQETADWQTYRNEEYEFEVKHPGDWEEINKTPAIMSFVCEGGENNIIQIRSMDRENNISLREQIKGKGYLEPELVKMNNKDFYFLKTSMAGVMFYEYCAEYKGSIFSISMVNMSDLPKNFKHESDITYLTDEEASGELNILRTMVSTFKFIEE